MFNSFQNGYLGFAIWRSKESCLIQIWRGEEDGGGAGSNGDICLEGPKNVKAIVTNKGPKGTEEWVVFLKEDLGSENKYVYVQ